MKKPEIKKQLPTIEEIEKKLKAESGYLFKLRGGLINGVKQNSLFVWLRGLPKYKLLVLILSSILIFSTGIAAALYYLGDNDVGHVTDDDSPESITVTNPDGSITMIEPDGTEITQLDDGTTITNLPDGTEIVTDPEGNVTVNPPPVEENEEPDEPDDPNDTIINVGEDLQTAIDNNQSGTTFTIKSGVHRLQDVVPKDGQKFVGETGAILNGSKILTNFSKVGSYWVISGQTQQQTVNGICEVGYDACQFAEEVFINDVMQIQVGTLAGMAFGKWFFDYDQDKIYLYSNPSGKTVETSVSAAAFSGSAKNVTIKNLIIEKYATPAQTGTIGGKTSQSATGWLVEDNEIRWNHGEGISLGNNMTVRNNNFHHNGRTGVAGGSKNGAVVDNNEIAYNCLSQIGFLCMGWGGGGLKVHGASNISFTDNYVHHNLGPGLHVDGDGDGSVFDGNTLKNNTAGISVEISCNSVISNNIIEDNNLVPGKGAGIIVISSPNVEVFGNSLRNNVSGILGRENGRGFEIPGCSPADLQNFYVHDNFISMNSGVSGVAQTVGSQIYFTGKNNRFKSNTYQLIGPETKYYRWMDQKIDKNAWQAYGQDTNGIWQ